LFEIRLVPKAASDFRIPFSKLAMEILCGQRFIQTQSYFKAGKSFRSNPFLGSEKDTGYVSDFARQSVLRGHGMYHFFFHNLDSNVYVRFSGRNTGKLHQILYGNGVLLILPGTGRSFRDLRAYSRVQCDYCHFGQYKR